MRHCKASAARTANSTALRFSTGRAPGSPRHTGHTFVLGGSPKRVEQEQKILLAVRSWTWTSSPITGSYFARAVMVDSELVTIRAIIERVGGGPPARQASCLVMGRGKTKAS